MFAVSPLRSADLHRAYPVARLHNPALSLASWRLYFDRQTGGDCSGLLAAVSPRSIIFGLAPWWLRPDLDCESILWSGPLIAVEPGAAGRVHGALVGALAEMAAQRACGGVYVVQPGDDPGSPLSHLDFSWYGAVLQRRLPQAATGAAA